LRSNLYTLEGGVHNYLREEGGNLWNGSLFVFDGRMAVPAPGACSPLFFMFAFEQIFTDVGSAGYPHTKSS
jgi:hypothetical protein